DNGPTSSAGALPRSTGFGSSWVRPASGNALGQDIALAIDLMSRVQEGRRSHGPEFEHVRVSGNTICLSLPAGLVWTYRTAPPDQGSVAAGCRSKSWVLSLPGVICTRKVLWSLYWVGMHWTHSSVIAPGGLPAGILRPVLREPTMRTTFSPAVARASPV